MTAFDTSEPVASSPRSKVKGWLRNRFSRGRAPGNDMLDSAGTDNRFAETDDRSEKSKNSSSKRRSFLWPTRAGAMGGIARSHQSNTSAISLDNASGIGSSSMRDVATAGRFGDVDAGEARPGSSADAGAAAGSIGNSVGTSNRVRRDSQGVSMCSSAATNDAEEAGPSRERERFYDTIDMLPPRPIGGGPGSRMSVSPSPSRDSRFHEDFD